MKLYENTNSQAFQLYDEATKYVLANTFMPLHVHQNTYSSKLKEELEYNATASEQMLVIMIAACICIVFVSLVIITPVFVWVIKDKSYVLAIFADVHDEEIKAVVGLADLFDIKSIRFKKSWIKHCKDDEDIFWTKVIKGHNLDKIKIQPSRDVTDPLKSPIKKLDKDSESVLKSTTVRLQSTVKPNKTEAPDPDAARAGESPSAPKDKIENAFQEEQKAKCAAKKASLSRLE